MLPAHDDSLPVLPPAATGFRLVMERADTDEAFVECNRLSTGGTDTAVAVVVAKVALRLVVFGGSGGAIAATVHSGSVCTS
jgi:hypothetical protein